MKTKWVIRIKKLKPWNREACTSAGTWAESPGRISGRTPDIGSSVVLDMELGMNLDLELVSGSPADSTMTLGMDLDSVVGTSTRGPWRWPWLGSGFRFDSGLLADPYELGHELWLGLKVNSESRHGLRLEQRMRLGLWVTHGHRHGLEFRLGLMVTCRAPTFLLWLRLCCSRRHWFGCWYICRLWLGC